ncbi:mannose-6-phosphate isomerase [Microstroma glucosiphilum]|uniref:Mannose-6-phosphate isomerase n=1 Tax=Pseudomicrostroma glucosiphilum TaxID=1684307 RepID=A0A316TYC9_9BASI|nr:mannose-6-phosphate isomerase [Pseudomicrostroma glucosiphilum]PWN18242.1 mannose-6-phosphate isomerase [Pseudomicrostroma glucosiphilum]
MPTSISSSKSAYGPSGPFGRAFQIAPGVQNYDWGITGKNGSLVAVYGQATEQLEMKVEDDKPYAELWMGTHPTLPSTIIPPPGSSSSSSNGSSSAVTLSSYLNEYPALLGQKVVDRYGTGLTRNGGKKSSDGKQEDVGALPFLFKVLSAGKALSIQAHPDKELAKKLHSEKPKSYKDDNHKPEMAIALTPFEGFCGFRPLQEIVHFLEVVPELRELVRPSDDFLAQVGKVADSNSESSSEEERKKYLRQIFSPLMKADSSNVEKQASALVERYSSALSSSSSLEVPTALAKLVCKLNSQFPGDVGIFCSFILNVVHLHPGQAMFLGANEPHAYIQGNIIECMAASDNVVRAGLTPKERDVDVLVDMLTYSHAGPEKQLLRPREFLPLEGSETYSLYSSEEDKEGGGKEVPSLLYDPPIEEFSVVGTHLAPGQVEKQRALQGPSLLIHTSGKGKLTATFPTSSQPSKGTQSDDGSGGGGSVSFDLDAPGKVFFIGADTRIDLCAAEGEKEKLGVFRAFLEVSGTDS